MIISRLYGGLGNQLFQYAIARKLSIDANKELLINKSLFSNGNYIHNYELDKFKITYDGYYDFNWLEKLKLKLVKIGLINFPNVLNEETYNIKINSFKEKYYLDDYWQDEKYFKQIKNILSDELMPKRISKNSKILVHKIQNTNSVCMHIRRGDYLKLENLDSLGVCSTNYYFNSVDLMIEKLDKPNFFVFSDDIEWCRNNIRINGNSYFIPNSFTNIDSFYLMRNCKHYIISNSTFSWWPAWLSNFESKIVIAPKIWWKSNPHNSPVLNNWIKINNE